MELPSYFEKFLREIRPTQSQKDDLIQGHTTLRSRLSEDEELQNLVVTTFLQGSYRRYTLIRPQGNELADVDVVVPTRIDTEKYKDPDKAMDLFVPFLNKHYSGKYKRQGRSFGIELSHVSLDLVIASVPSLATEDILLSEAVSSNDTLGEAVDWRLVSSWIPEGKRDIESEKTILTKVSEEQEWKAEPLLIPDRDVGKWTKTNPLEQMKWTHGKNARCNQHYLGVVKAIKWWQFINANVPNVPSGYPLEHMIGYCCPDWITGVAEGVVRSFENFLQYFRFYIEQQSVPVLQDHGVSDSNVLKRITPTEFLVFFENVEETVAIARNALDETSKIKSADLWRELFGEKFPPANDNGDDESNDPKGPFAILNKSKPTGDTGPSKYA